MQGGCDEWRPEHAQSGSYHRYCWKGDVMKNTGLDRRSFVQLLSGAAAAGLGVLPEAAAQARAGSATTSRPPANRADTTLKKNVVAIQVKPFCWVDEGIEQVLDNLQ